ncbi:pyruvate kinase [Methylovorus glucosotrophus]|uniref:pyruvate kinase n=1 Tax=Methylovorus glucosotrophus TaxID=266009 RepID=UPI0013316504|nr:pyruvate kinase [Methylovorus glucosotrophus]KAF0836346.1 pyruvate kinase [Methylovorus glucosotrophus]
MELRRTKIVATLGPASSEREVLERMLDAGVDVVRLNFSHGQAADHIARAELVRELARARRRSVGVLCDLQGPKIRIGKFADGKVLLRPGDNFILDADCPLGDQSRVGLDYKTLPQEVVTGTVLLLDDGRIVLTVDSVEGSAVYCTVKVGGLLSNNKGINRLGGGLAAEALTEKDREDIKTAAALSADYIAISFPRSGADVELARQLVQEAGGHAHIVAKIERAEAIPALEEIVDAADVIMVARGDLGVEVGDAVVPGLQKRMIRLARAKNKLVITATQMMESMILNPIPTRAEVSDVANAVLDGTDAVMLSAETAAGQFPVEAVSAMHRVCKEAEKEYYDDSVRRLGRDTFDEIDEAIAMATSYSARHFNVKAIAALTQSGKSAIWLSRANNNVPIYALTPEQNTRRKLTLCRGVYPYRMEVGSHDIDRILFDAEEELVSRGVVTNGDYILLTFGQPIGKAGSTNTMKLVQVGEHRQS